MSFSSGRILRRTSGLSCPPLVGGAVSRRPYALAALAALGCFESQHFAFVDVAPNQPAPDAGASAAPSLPGLEAPSQAAPPGTPVPAASEAPGGAGDTPAAAAAASVDAGSVLPAGETCVLPTTAEAGAVLYGGLPVAGVCPASLDAPYGTNWFTYQDSADPLVVTPLGPSCDPALCSLRVDGPAAGSPGYSSYGAGVALPLSVDNSPVDLTRFAGIQLWVRGTLVGTRGVGASDAPQTLFLKLVTSTVRNGDDFGVFCQVDPNAWTACGADFAAFSREGFSAPDPAADVFDPQNALRVELELRLFRDALGAVPVPVSAALELAQISFY
jgi:hypothetical protein